MKIAILYREASDHGREVTEYVKEFTHRNPEVALELISIDTREGANLATTYDIMQYPAILAIKEDGQLAHEWQGSPLPLMNEVVYFTIV